MSKSMLLYKYPCGCVGMGRPHAPRKEDGENIWDDVLVVKVCDPSRYQDDDGWLLPAPRLLTGLPSEHPEPMTEVQEGDYFEFLRSTMKNAAKWNRLRRVVRDIKEMEDE